MAVDNVTVNTSTGVDGSTYTSSISNDQLTTSDFLQLMLTELKYQDPTEPMDSQRMMDTQMQMSSINTNLKTIETMQALQSSIANMTLSNAMNFMGKKVDAIYDAPVLDADGNAKKDADGNTITEKVKASFYINTVKIDDGVTYLESSELIGLKDRAVDLETNTVVNYDLKTGQIKDSNGDLTDYYIKLDDDGMFDTDTSGNIVITDKDGNVQTVEYTPDGSTDKTAKFSFVGTDEIYSQNNTNLKYDEIVKVY